MISGDLVIKKTGGNKMLVVDNKDGIVHCIWATDSCYSEYFKEEDLIPAQEFDQIIRQLSRHDRIDELFNNISK